MKRALAPALAAAALALAACGGTSLGQPCTTNDECVKPWTCYTKAPAGYCTRGCSFEGTSKDCPGGTVCTSSAGSLVCALTCQAATDCRVNYDCAAVTGSTLKACTAK